MHHFWHMLSIIKDMGRKGFEDFKEGEAALLSWAKKDPAEEEVFPVHLDECIEFQQEATSWGQECVGMGLERSSTSDGEDGLELGKAGMCSRRNIHTRRLHMEEVQSVSYSFSSLGTQKFIFHLIKLTGPQIQGRQSSWSVVLTYNILLVLDVQQSDSVTHIYVYVNIILLILFHYRLLL